MLIAGPDVVIPSQSAVDRAKSELERALGPSKVDTSDAACANYGRDESEAVGRAPDVVVFAEGRDDIARTLQIAEACGVPVTPRGAGTGRTGGAVPVAGGIVLCTHKLAQIKEIDRTNLFAVVEPGLVTGDLHAACEKEGLFYPPDPNSLKECMIGGNVAENAGGPRAFKYGVTREYVLGLEACFMGGKIMRTGKRTVKGVTGYDVTALLVGSEGTLGVFSEVTLKLVRNPPEVATLLALFDDVHACGEAVTRIIADGLVPRCLELLDAATLDAVRAQGVSIDGRARAMLLIEVDGDADGMDRQMERVGESIERGRGVVAVLVAQDASQRARLWEARRALSPATRKLAKYKLSEDIVVPRSRISDLLRRMDGIGETHAIQHLTYGHAGDGNLHVNVLWNDESERPRIDAALWDLMRTVIEFGGTLSGEHGIGVSKAQFLPLEQSEDLIQLQRDIKGVFDPKGLLNPGKIFPSVGRGHGGC